MLRIRYTDHKYKKDNKVSIRQYTSKGTGAKYRIILNLENLDPMQYYIRNERTKEYVFKSGTFTNLNVLKRNARAKLGDFGVLIGKEIRDRSFGLCKSGFSQKEWEEKELFGKNDEEL